MKYILLMAAVLALTTIACKSEQKSEAVPGMRVVSGELTYSVPDQWKETTPKGRMRKAQYILPGTGESGDAEMAVFVFPGSGGSVRANIDRWIGQFQPAPEQGSVYQELNDFTTNGLNVTTVYARGTYMQSSGRGMGMGGPVTEMPDYAMLAAIVETSGDPWFFKAVGPQETIDHWRADFDKFCQSFKGN